MSSATVTSYCVSYIVTSPDNEDGEVKTIFQIGYKLLQNLNSTFKTREGLLSKNIVAVSFF